MRPRVQGLSFYGVRRLDVAFITIADANIDERMFVPKTYWIQEKITKTDEA